MFGIAIILFHLESGNIRFYKKLNLMLMEATKNKPIVLDDTYYFVV